MEARQLISILTLNRANKIKNELAVAMVLTGAQTVKDINRSMVVIPEYKA